MPRNASENAHGPEPAAKTTRMSEGVQDQEAHCQGSPHSRYILLPHLYAVATTFSK